MPLFVCHMIEFSTLIDSDISVMHIGALILAVTYLTFEYFLCVVFPIRTIYISFLPSCATKSVIVFL